MTASPTLRSQADVAAFMQGYYDAWSGTDEDLILSYYADAVVLQIPGSRLEGKEAVRDQFVRPFITAFPGNWHQVRNRIYGPGVAVVEFTFEAEHKGPFAGHAATGARVVVPGCGVYQYDAVTRQITAARIYFDVGTLLQTITTFPADDRGKAAEALRLNERTWNLIVNTIPTMAWTARPDGYCDFLNQRWLDYAGMREEQATGWGWAEAIHPDDRNRLIDYWRACLASGGPVEAEGRMRGFDGSYRWCLFRANPVRDETGTIVKWYGTNIDIDDQKRADEALHRARTELAHMARITTLSALTASIAHEINQPISAAVMSAGACLRWLNRDEPDVQRAREAAMRAEEDGKRAADIITHLKWFYKKDVVPERELVPLNDVVGEMLSLLRSEAAGHSVVMRTALAPDLPPVSADRVQLQQVLMNLMLNGMEAMDGRGGELTIRTEQEKEAVRVSVSDTGAGIPADKIENIFNAFFTTKPDGTGMGLPISRTIIESHGGELWASLNPERGTTFHFTLPTDGVL